MYVATVLLRRTEREFWRMAPIKLNALVKAHIKMNDPEGAKEAPGSKSNHGFIDQVF